MPYPGWLDHEGTSTRLGQKVFVSEPYALGPEVLQAAIDFATAVDADLTISPTSHHFPTRCLRIEISEKQEVKTDA